MEMATTGAYANPLTITAFGSLTNTTVNLRIAASAAAGSITGNVNFASTNATTQNVAVSGTVAGSGGSGVFISQVYEGASYDKYVEVYNPGPSTVDLASPQIKLVIWSVTGDAGTGAATGAATTSSNLTGTIPAGGALVFKNTGAANPAYIVSNATANGSVNFNGNDAIALTDNSNTILDVFGVGINNKDKNYTRNASVFGPSATFVESDWTSGANAVADSASTGVNDRLGYHQHSGGDGGTGPTITSSNAFSGTVGVAFSNTITATGSAPIAFSGTGLPNGLSVATNGVISGTPTAAGTFTNAVLTATNAAGTNNQAATFTIAKGTPVINLAPTASAITAGAALSSSTLTGGSASVEGTFYWTSPSAVPESTGSHEVTFTPTDTANYNTATTTVSVTVNSAGTTYSGWLSGAGASDAAFLDYVFGALTPGTLDPSLKPTVAVTGGNLVLTYYVRQGTVGLTVTPKTSADLAAAPGDWVEVIPVDVDVAREVNGIIIQQKTASVPVSGTKKFLRVEAVQQ
jgi:hypothetical protein